MSITILNMNMPIGCQKCKFFKKHLFGNGLDYSYSCILGAKDFPMPWIRQMDERASDCPLIETKKRKTMTREEAIKQLNKLKSFHNGSYGEAINFAIESLKVDLAYDLAYEKVDFIEISEGATNGDMINALFPNAKNIRVDGGYPLNYIIEGEWHRNLKEWWNAPYKAESEEKK